MTLVICTVSGPVSANPSRKPSPRKGKGSPISGSTADDTNSQHVWMPGSPGLLWLPGDKQASSRPGRDDGNS